MIFIECFYKVYSLSEVSELFSLKMNYLFSMIFLFLYINIVKVILTLLF